MPLLTDILSSHVRAEVFRILFDNIPVRLHLRELARRSDLALATIRQDVKKLVGMDLLVEEEDGNRKYYSANELHPCYAPIRDLVSLTVGRPTPVRGFSEAAARSRISGQADTGLHVAPVFSIGTLDDLDAEDNTGMDATACIDHLEQLRRQTAKDLGYAYPERLQRVLEVAETE